MEGYADRSCWPVVAAACAVTRQDLASTSTGGDEGLQNWLAVFFTAGYRIVGSDYGDPSLSLPFFPSLTPHASDASPIPSVTPPCRYSAHRRTA